jgi:hypothetical protein
VRVVAREAVDAVAGRGGERAEIRAQRGDGLRRVELDVEVPRPEVVPLDREQRPGNPERGEDALRIRDASRSSSTGTTPAPVSSRMTTFCRGAPSTNAEPRVGCPAKGSSRDGVKIRMRTSASGADAGSTNTVSAKFISRASACMSTSLRSRASVKTASWLPASGTSVKTSQTT